MEEWREPEGGFRLTYARTDYQRILEVLGRRQQAVDAAAAALAEGLVEPAAAAIDEACAGRRQTSDLYPDVIVNDEDRLAFSEVYPDLYDVDLLLIVTFQWPDSSPTGMSDIKELVDAFAESLANLRQLRARPWAAGGERQEALAAVEGLIEKTEELRAALDHLPPGSRIDPRKHNWLGQDYKARFLNGVDERGTLGTMYTFLFSIDHALERARWSLAHGKKPGAARRLGEFSRAHAGFVDWMRQDEPAT